MGGYLGGELLPGYGGSRVSQSQVTGLSPEIREAPTREDVASLSEKPAATQSSDVGKTADLVKAFKSGDNSLRSFSLLSRAWSESHGAGQTIKNVLGALVNWVRNIMKDTNEWDETAKLHT